MRKRRNSIITTVVAALVLPLCAYGQNSSINTFSPYTFYGIGDMHTPGTIAMRSMGGVGLGMQSSVAVNVLNPAALGTMSRKSFLFNFGMEGQNFYAKQGDKSTSYNTFNVRDIVVQFPLAKNLGFGFSVNPFSSVGYRVKVRETNPDIIADVGAVNYVYSGEGGINEARASVGWRPLKRLSIGVSAIYYMGDIDRDSGVGITPITGEGTYNQTLVNDNESISRIMWNVGLQYNIVSSRSTLLTLGAVYHVGSKLNAKVTRNVSSNNIFSDTVSYVSGVGRLTMPTSIGAGIFLQRSKVQAGIDYTFRNWHDVNREGIDATVAYRNTNTIGVGFEFTPNRGDVRRALNRWSYRIGYRYNDYYMTYRGQNLYDHAISIGLGIPVKRGGFSGIDLGLEVGRRGTTSKGLIRETYFKFSLGISMFGEDFWFMRPKFD